MHVKCRCFGFWICNWNPTSTPLSDILRKMGKGNKIKPLVPPGKAPSKAAKPVTSLKLARKLTTSFHGLLHQEDLIKKDAALAPEAKRAKLKEIEQQIVQMGGREAYQEASALATKNFRSSRYVYKTLMKYGLQPRHGEPHLRVSLPFLCWPVGRVLRQCDLHGDAGSLEEAFFFDRW